MIHRQTDLKKTLMGAAGVWLLLPLWPASARAEAAAADETLAKQVFARLLATAPAPQGMEWPPELDIVDKDDINAYAAIRKEEKGPRTLVVCYSGLLKRVAEGDADRVAYVLGHELAHHLLGHTQIRAGETEFLRATFTRAQELAADRKGMELALRANYSYKGGLAAIRRMMDLGLNYSSFEGLSADHPSWFDRIAQLDKEQAGLWRSMSSFDNGVYFLLAQNYPLAERAFRQVTREFPSSYEAWADLGYAQLMQYADGLDAGDLRRFDVGQIVAGGFYRRPKSLEGKVRGINEELWAEAVRSLREALKLKGDLSLAKASLGIAYLVRPAGKDAAQAVALLEEAVKLAENDNAADPVSRLATELNLAVAYDAAGNGEKAGAALGRVETAMKERETRSLRGAAAVADALAYNRALLLARSPDGQRQKLAIRELERYLKQTGPSVAWWQLAYQRYAGLCRQSGTAAVAETALLSQPGAARLRPVAGLQMGGAQVVLGENVAEARAALGAPASSAPAVRNGNLTKLEYPERGVKLLAGDEVLAIILTGEHAPALPVREMGLGSKSIELKVGMTVARLDELMGEADYDFRQLTDPEENYRFYSDLGVAVLVKNGMVAELVISQVPRRKPGI